MMTSSSEQVQQEFEKLNDELQTLKQGWIQVNDEESSTSCRLIWTKKDVKNMKTIHYVQDYAKHEASTWKPTMPTLVSPSNQLLSLSPSGKYTLTAEETSASSEKSNHKQTILHLWTHESLVRSFILPSNDESKMHGELYCDARHDNLSWSEDETKVIYLAEKNRPSSENFDYRVDWGEQYTDKVQAEAFHLDLGTGEIFSISELFPPNLRTQLLSIGEVQYVSGTGMVFTGYHVQHSTTNEKPEQELVRLGYIYCHNRPSRLYHFDFQAQELTCLTPHESIVCSPRLSPNGLTLVYLATNMITHHGCFRMCVLRNWKTTKSEILIDMVQEPVSNDDIGWSFCGIYCPQLPKRCWSRDGQKCYFNTFVGSNLVWKQVDVMTGEMACPGGGYLPDPENQHHYPGYQRLVDVHLDQFLIERSAPNIRPRVGWYASFDSAVPEYLDLDSRSINRDNVQDMTWTLMRLRPDEWTIQTPRRMTSNGTIPHPDLECYAKDVLNNDPYEMILLLPKSKTQPPGGWPVILDIHGGPHGGKNLVEYLNRIIRIICMGSSNV